MKSLRIKLPIGQIVLQAFGWLLSFFLLMEALARTSIVKNLHLYESYGSSHPKFDTQIAKIKSKFNQDKHIDCVFIGNSQTSTGIDPAIVEETYFKETGAVVHCYNFGLTGLEPVTAASLAHLLIKNFHPSLIVFGTELYDYTATDGGADQSIMSSPWVQYQLEVFSIDGWLIENSLAYRYYLGLNQNSSKDTDIDENGHLTFHNSTEKTQDALIENVHEKSKNIKIHEAQINGLRELLSINSDVVKIAVLEMPVNPIVFSLESNAARIYPDFRNILVNETSRAGVELWLTKDIIEIPENGWYDFVHQNQTGAFYFSTFIGSHLAIFPFHSTEPTIQSPD